ncbi:hypothetical protein QYM36_015781 [Artemia franciscana]|uniref:Uncharacterized protein n=1 Tax=Artemia franciscana TaxID=6661 RepID=A0AA88HEG1_ARTSF|nr:hypothetical protein QYM36_015781 [Artemia franciscana]
MMSLNEGSSLLPSSSRSYGIGEKEPENVSKEDNVEVIDETRKENISSSRNVPSPIQHDSDTYFADQRIDIPNSGEGGFSFAKLWAFTGPGFLMSIAYLDPGNIESDLRSGAVAEYKLLWILLWATVLGLLVQRLTVRLGVVTGKHLAEHGYRNFPFLPRICIWLMSEIAIIGSDMQEVIGTSIAIYILSSRTVPIWVGVLITIADTFTFLLLDKYGLRKLEFFFGFLITVMGISFGYEYVKAAPDQLKVLSGIVIPSCKGCGSEELIQAVGIIGAVIMPHNLYLHSALVKSRDIDRKNKSAVREGNFYFFLESGIALFCSFVINVFVVSVFAAGLYQKTNADIIKLCNDSGGAINEDDVQDAFGNGLLPEDYVDASIYSGGIYLGCKYGYVATIIWGIGILAAGQSSTMTGTYAGQFVMEGFLNLQWPRWKRVLLTRSIAVLPALLIAIFAQIRELTTLNDLLNAIMSLQLPFALLPTLIFTCSPKIMGEFVNGIFNKIVIMCLGFAVISINIYFVVFSIFDSYPFHPAIFLPIALGALFYFTLIGYLVVHLVVSLGGSFCLKSKFISRLFVNPMQYSDEDKLEEEVEDN